MAAGGDPVRRFLPQAEASSHGSGFEAM